MAMTSLLAASAGVPSITPASIAPSSAATQTGASSFAGTLGGLIEGVEQSTSAANVAVTGMLNKTVDVHDAMIALQRSELALQLTVQVRNKLVQAYQDVMRMPI